MAEPIPFDLGMEILRGTDAALAMHNRRTRLALAAMPDPYATTPRAPRPSPRDWKRHPDYKDARGLIRFAASLEGWRTAAPAARQMLAQLAAEMRARDAAQET